MNNGCVNMSLSNVATLYFDKASSNFEYVAPIHSFRHLTVNGTYCNVFIIKDGNIGVGTFTPTCAMDVHGTINIANDLNVSGNITAANISGAQNPTPTRHTEIVDSPKDTFEIQVNGIYTYTEADVDVYINGLKLGYISPSFNDFTVTSVGSGDSTAITIALNQQTDVNDVVEIVVHHPLIYNNYINASANSNEWLSANTSLVTEANVGIGTLNPQSTLHVEGDIFAHHISASNIIYKNEPIMQTISPVSVQYEIYSKTFSWIYRGADPNTRNVQKLFIQSYLHSHCNVQSYLENPSFGYDLKIVNTGNNSTVSELGLSNAEPITHVMPLTSLGQSNTTFELHVRKKSYGDYVYIDAVTFGY
jgi:hypothetical protein